MTLYSWSLLLAKFEPSSMVIFFVTIISHVADNPLSVLTVILAVPLFTPLTTPDDETVATFVLLDDQVSVYIALDGVIVGDSVIELPTSTSSKEDDNSTFVGTGLT